MRNKVIIAAAVASVVVGAYLTYRFVRFIKNKPKKEQLKK